MSEIGCHRQGARAVFLDRDGVLNELVVRNGVGVSPRRAEDFRVRDEATSAVGRLERLGLKVFVATNQPDIARGLLRPDELRQMNTRLCGALPVHEVAVCPHDDHDDCACRKPRPGMLLDLADRWQVSLSESFLIGDSWKDIEAGRRAGCYTILVASSLQQRVVPDAVVQDLGAAVALIEARVLTAASGHRASR